MSKHCALQEISWTTAVFLIKYLRFLGFDVTKDVFAKNSWHFRNALVRANYNDYTKDIQETKQDIQEAKQNIEIQDGLNSKTKQHIRDLFLEFGYDRFLGRSDVQNIIGITAYSASALIKRMLELELIYPMKGKYIFKNGS